MAIAEEIIAEEFAKLPKAKLARLGSIKSAYPGVPLEKLPGDLKREVSEILETVHKAARANMHSSGQSKSRETTPQSQKNTRQDHDDTTAHAHNDYTKLYSIIGTDLNEDIDIAISQKARLQSLYCIGASGTGKTTLLANLILQDIRQGLGVALIEPHGDLTKTVLAGIPDNRLGDVILLNMTDSSHPFGLNLYQCDTPNSLTEVAKTASFVMHVFEKVWGVGAHTPQLTQVLRNVTRTLIENPGTTFAEIPLLVWENTVREKLLTNLKNPQSQMFWTQYGRKTQRDRDELISSTINKVDAYLNEPMIANIVSQEKTTLNFRQIMDEGKILLVHLSPQLEEMSRLVGAMLIGKLLMAAFSRVDTPEENRRQFNLYCDEFQRFATSDFATLISEARKFRIATTLSHQTLTQLDEANKAAAIASGNLIVLRVSGDDAKELARNFDTTPSREIVGEEPIRAPVSDVISHLVKRGHNDQRVAQFAQEYLTSLENFVSRPAHVGLYGPPSNMQSDYAWYGVVLFKYSDISQARELLNSCLYRSMSESTTHFLIPPLALYMLSVAQQDRSDTAFEPYIKLDWPDHYFLGFKKIGEATAEVFGDPYFINQDYATKFINSRQQKGFFGSVTRQSQWEMESARRLVNMITELRFTMAVLAKQPVLVDTGQYQPKYQNRTFADMENQIARDLTQQPNFQAKAKLLSGEHTIKTKNYPPLLTGRELTERIAQVQAQTRRDYCKPRREVEIEIRERQEKWRRTVAPEEPPPTHY